MSRAQRVLNLLKAPLRSYNEVAQKYPFETGVVTTVVKTSLADMFAQKVSQQEATLLWRSPSSSPSSNSSSSSPGSLLGCSQHHQ
jgi:hypothetical protein